MLGHLRVNVDAYIPRENPYSYEGTDGPWVEQELQRAFAKANVIEVAVDSHRLSSFFGISVRGTPAPPMSSSEIAAPPVICTIKVTKVGLLNRKDDLLEGGKKAANRKWKPWSVVLTGSQLLLFRDAAWATTLLAQSKISNGQIVLTQSSVFRPDELLSVRESVAVFDTSYHKVRLFLILSMLSLTTGHSMTTRCASSWRMVDNFSCRRQTAEN